MKQKVCTLKVFEVMNLRMMLKNVRNKWKESYWQKDVNYI